MDWPPLTIAIATAVCPVPTDPAILTIGEFTYPLPGFVIANLLIPLLLVSIEQVAIALVPPPPTIEIVGATVYPAPAFVNIIDWME